MTQCSRKIRSPDTWDAARDAYLAGSSAEDVCARLDLGLSAFRKRAREGGWRRADQPDPIPWDDEADDLPDIDDRALADLAFRRMSVEARQGRLTQALGWGRLREMVLRQAAVQARLDPAAPADATPDPRGIQGAAATMAPAARAASVIRQPAKPPLEVHEVHDVHPVSRAERRRRAALQRKTGPP